ncbi:DNA polymerase II subunit B3-1 [Gastrolobium bilobum]|uniref:DNA polymerase II subunit B3-1 n=1 Tax=Gastrolobium bilobum TaxID=150636 RepID=UPI002AB28E11|nr:DNA polymerase II subunit B3-1 [Gastrolobium bilobum]
MASSINSKSEKNKTKNRETSSIGSKTKKNRDSEKENEKKKKNKKLKLSNGNSKRPEQQEAEEDKTVVSNGRTSGTKPKKSKGKQREHEEEEVGEVEGGEEDAKTNVFPMNRIRTMIKGEDPDLRVSQEAILAINKAAEKFLEQFTQDAYACSVQDRKKSLNYKHLSYVVSKQRRYDFLSDFVPEKMKAEDALRERNSGGNGGD